MATKVVINKARALVVGIAQKGAEIDALVEQLRGLKLTFSDYKGLRADFCRAYCEAKGADPKDKTVNAAARKAWSRVLKAVGVERPLSENEEAKRKRQARLANKAGGAGAGAGADEGAPKAPAAGAKIGAKIMMELTASEAHLVQLLRRGQLAAAVDYIHKIAEAAHA